MLPDVSEPACRKVLEPYHDALWRIASGGVEGFRQLPENDQRILGASKRSKANAIHAYMMDEAANELMAIPGITPHTKYESTTYEFPGQIESRFKKLSAEGKSSNYPTPRALSFIGMAQYEIFADQWAAPIRLDIGYVLDKLGQAVEKVLVVRRNGRFVDWMYEIEAPAVSIAVVPILSPVAPAPTPVRIVAKGEGKKRTRRTGEKGRP